MKHDRPFQFADSPGGIEYVVALAAGDARFRGRLLRDRSKAVKRAGLRLTKTETTLLDAIPDEQLAATIDHATPITAPRRGFLRTALGAMAAVFGGVSVATISGCPGPVPVGGARPDEPTPASQGVRPTTPEPATDGIRPDVPEPATKGIRPDVPDDEPAPSTVTGSRPDMPEGKSEEAADESGAPE